MIKRQCVLILFRVDQLCLELLKEALSYAFSSVLNQPVVNSTNSVEVSDTLTDGRVCLPRLPV